MYSLRKVSNDSFKMAADFHDYGFSELSYLGLSPSDPRTLGMKQNFKDRSSKVTKPVTPISSTATWTTLPPSYTNIPRTSVTVNNNVSSPFEPKVRGRRATMGNGSGPSSGTSPSLPSLPTSKSTGREPTTTSCTRHELYVDFDTIGWSSWIISPKGYNAYYCKGLCGFPLGQNQWPSNHATVQSIVHALNLTPGVGPPCCVPNKLYSISLLYFDEHGNVILKQYDDMVAASCGCQ